MSTLTLESLRNITLGIFALAMFVFTGGIAMAPYAAVSPVGPRATKRARAMAAEGMFPMVEPLLRWAGAHLDAFLSEELRAKTDQNLKLGGDFYGLTPPEFLSAYGLCAVGGAVVGLLIGAGVGESAPGFTAALLVLASVFPYVTLTEAITKRQRDVSRGLPSVIDHMALAMSAGLDFPAAVRQVIDSTPDPNGAMADELSRMLQELSLGQTRREALLEFARRVPVSAVTEFVAAVVQAEEKGNPVIDCLLVQAQVSRTRRSVRAEETASKAGVAMSAPLFLIFGCTILLILGPLLLGTSFE